MSLAATGGFRSEIQLSLVKTLSAVENHSFHLFRGKPLQLYAYSYCAGNLTANVDG